MSRWVAGSVGSSEGCDDELTDGHVEGTTDQHPSSTNSLHEEEGWDGHDDIDDVGGNGEEVGVAGSGGGKESSTVVEDEVDTSELLHSLETSTSDNSEQDLSLTTLEQVEVGTLGVSSLKVEGSLDVGELGSNNWVVLVGRVQSGEGLGSSLSLANLDEPSRRLWEEEETDGQDGGKCELETDGEMVGCLAVVVLGGVFNDGGEEETDGDAPLVGRYDGTSNPSGSDFGLVEDDQGRDTTDTETSNDSTDDEEVELSGNHLENDTDAEDGEDDLQTPSSTEEVTERSTTEGTKKGTSRQDTGDEGSLTSGEVVGWGSDGGVGGGSIWVVGSVLLQEGLHGQETTDDTSVITWGR